VSHIVACCDQPPYREQVYPPEGTVIIGALTEGSRVFDQPQCNGICLFGSDIGVPSDAIAYAHPDCELHGHLAAYEVDGSPRVDRRYHLGVADRPDIDIVVDGPTYDALREMADE
jgi:hypothetical protein